MKIRNKLLEHLWLHFIVTEWEVWINENITQLTVDNYILLFSLLSQIPVGFSWMNRPNRPPDNVLWQNNTSRLIIAYSADIIGNLFTKYTNFKKVVSYLLFFICSLRLAPSRGYENIKTMRIQAEAWKLKELHNVSSRERFIAWKVYWWMHLSVYRFALMHIANFTRDSFFFFFFSWLARTQRISASSKKDTRSFSGVGS